MQYTDIDIYERFEFQDGTYATPGQFTHFTTLKLNRRLAEVNAADPDGAVYEALYRAALAARRRGLI